MVRDALSALVTEGVKAMLIVHEPPAPNEMPQVSATSVKSPALAPVTAMLVMLNAALPVLLRVTVWAALVMAIGSLPKARLEGETPATGLLVPDPPVPLLLVPVPVRVTDCGLPLALSVRVRAALRDPAAAGVKVTLIVQLAPTATLDSQLLVCPKALGFVPVMPILVMLKAASPVLLSVTDWAALVEPTVWLAKVRLGVERLASGAGSSPPTEAGLSATICIVQPVFADPEEVSVPVAA
jgi:hypothetical protein